MFFDVIRFFFIIVSYHKIKSKINIHVYFLFSRIIKKYNLFFRTKNMRKEVRAPPTAGVTFCLCQKRQYGVMTQCELCKDWFHGTIGFLCY